MQLPAFFGHKKSINLLPRDEFESSAMGVVLEWALAFGKWAVILTQLIVMGTFLWRFSLDRQLTDLKKSINKNVAIIKSYEQIEKDFILTQKRVSLATKILDQQNKESEILTQLTQITPADVWLDKLNITESTVNLSAYAGSLNGFGQFLTAAQKVPLFKSITVNKIQDGGTENAQMQFDLTITYNTGVKTAEKL